MKLAGAIFDLDGTLIDSMSIWDSLGVDFLGWKGYEPAKDLRETLRPMTIMQAAHHFRIEYHLPESDVEIMNQIFSFVENKYYNLIPLKEGVASFLYNLKIRNVKMCVVTASHRHLAQAALKRLEIDQYFCCIITCMEFGKGKNQPDIYFEALKMLQTDIRQTVVFEDALHAIQTAKSAGFLVAGVSDKSAYADTEEIKSNVDWYLHSLDEWEIDES